MASTTAGIGTVTDLNGTCTAVKAGGSRLNAPLQYSGSLDAYESFDVAAVIGREFPRLQLSDIVNDDDKVRDLAVIASQRGVVFFRNQDLDVQTQKVLAQRLGELSGKPETSKLHRHALSHRERGIPIDDAGTVDEEAFVMSSELERKIYPDRFKRNAATKLASDSWHCDITFERVPSDYAILKISTLPDDVGGDTIWASGYEAYDRLSPVWQKFAEGLTATHYQPSLVRAANEQKFKLIDRDRGSPDNYGLDFQTSHPVVRTNPVTGWKSLFAAGNQLSAGWIDGMKEHESNILKKYWNQLIMENHDLQVRFRWRKNDVCIWDNRCTYHTPTNDYTGKRWGVRIISLGERPYFDPDSVSRREGLGLL